MIHEPLTKERAYFLSSCCASVLVETRFDKYGSLVPRARAFETRDAALRKVQVGAGKSSKMHKDIADIIEAWPEVRIGWLTNTTQLGKQSKANLDAATSRDWLLYRGFDSNEEGKPLCSFSDEARALLRVGGDPYTTLCPGCPDQSSCLLWAQYESRSSLVVTTHAQMRHGLKPYDERNDFDIVVIDEDPTSILLATESHALSFADNVDYSGDHAPSLEAVVQGIRRAAKVERRLRMQDLPRPHDIHALLSVMKPSKPTILRGQPVDEGGVAKAEARIKVSNMLRDLLDAMAMVPSAGGDIAGCMPELSDKGEISIDIAVVRDIHPQFANAQDLFILSATAEPILLRRSIPNLRLDEDDWQPYEYGKFIYVEAAKASRNQLLDGSQLAQGGGEALEALETIARSHERVLLICQKAVRKALEVSGLPDNVATAHFNAVEGLNDFAQFDALIILGRELPADKELILQAEAAAVGYIDAELYRMTKEGKRVPTWGKQVRRERIAMDGSAYTTTDYRHPNPYVDAMRRLVTYAGVTQSDRSRGQHRKLGNPVTIYDMTGLDNVWQIDEVTHWRALCGPFSEMMGHGFMLHPASTHGSNDLLAALFPDHFSDAAAAKNYRAYAKRVLGITLEMLVGQCSFRDGVVVDTTLPGARYGVPVIVDAETEPEAVALISQYLPPGTKISNRSRDTL